jgi:ABC-type glycerol-3-phosphate transport system permease component
MNGLRWVLLIALMGFVALLARAPKTPRLAFAYLRWVVLLGVSVVVLAPFLWLIAAAFKDQAALNDYIFFPPLSEWSDETMNLDNFRALFRGDQAVQGKVYFWQYVLNSTFVASANTVLQLTFCSAAGFALAKYDFHGKRALMLFMLGTMMIPSVLLFAPVYEMMVGLGLVDTYQGLILPSIVSAYGIFLFRQAMLSVPDEMLDAGRIDGCSELHVYFALALPLVRPMSAAFCLLTFLGQWNSFFGPSVFLQAQDKLTLPVVLNQYINFYRNDYGVYLAGTLLAIVPPAILFFALEREFVSGLTAGAVKG